MSKQIDSCETLLCREEGIVEIGSFVVLILNVKLCLLDFIYVALKSVTAPS